MGVSPSSGPTLPLAQYVPNPQPPLPALVSPPSSEPGEDFQAQRMGEAPAGPSALDNGAAAGPSGVKSFPAAVALSGANSGGAAAPQQGSGDDILTGPGSGPARGPGGYGSEECVEYEEGGFGLVRPDPCRPEILCPNTGRCPDSSEPSGPGIEVDIGMGAAESGLDDIGCGPPTIARPVPPRPEPAEDDDSNDVYSTPMAPFEDDPTSESVPNATLQSALLLAAAAELLAETGGALPAPRRPAHVVDTGTQTEPPSEPFSSPSTPSTPPAMTPIVERLTYPHVGGQLIRLPRDAPDSATEGEGEGFLGPVHHPSMDNPGARSTISSTASAPAVFIGLPPSRSGSHRIARALSDRAALPRPTLNFMASTPMAAPLDVAAQTSLASRREAARRRTDALEREYAHGEGLHLLGGTVGVDHVFLEEDEHELVIYAVGERNSEGEPVPGRGLDGQGATARDVPGLPGAPEPAHQTTLHLLNVTKGKEYPPELRDRAPPLRRLHSGGARLPGEAPRTRSLGHSEPNHSRRTSRASGMSMDHFPGSGGEADRPPFPYGTSPHGTIADVPTPGARTPREGHTTDEGGMSTGTSSWERGAANVENRPLVRKISRRESGASLLVRSSR